MYDAAARFWQDFIHDFMEAYAAVGPVLGKKRTNVKALLWGAHQRFFLQMCLAIKYGPLVSPLGLPLTVLPGWMIVYGLHAKRWMKIVPLLSDCSQPVRAPMSTKPVMKSTTSSLLLIECSNA